MKTSPSSPRSSLWAASVACLGLLLSPMLTTNANADWVVEGNTVYFSDHVGYSSDGSQFSGTVSLRMDLVTVSGQTKITTTILSVAPEPGFSANVKKSGGVNGTVEIAFSSASCQSKFSFLYKPGLTKIDYGVMRCN